MRNQTTFILFLLAVTVNGSAISDEARRTGANAIKAVNVQFTKSTAMRDTLSPSAVEFALQEDISNDWPSQQADNQQTPP